jgi:hypothetical protein
MSLCLTRREVVERGRDGRRKAIVYIAGLFHLVNTCTLYKQGRVQDEHEVALTEVT